MLKFLPLLWYKDFLWHKGHILNSVFQFLIPLLISIVFCIYMRTNDMRTPMPMQSIMSHEYGFLSNYTGYEIGPKVAIFVSPSISTTTTGISTMINKFEMPNTFIFEGVLNKDNMTNVLKNGKYSCFVLFDKFSTVVPFQLSYRIVDLKWSFQRNHGPLWGVWSVNQLPPSRGSTDLETKKIQMLIEGEFLVACQKASENPFNQVIQHQAMPLFNENITRFFTVLAQVCTAVSVFTILQACTQMREERRSGAKIMFRNLGVSVFQYTFAYFLIYFLKFLIVQAVFWIPIFCATKISLIPSLLVPGIILYSAVLSTFSIFMGTLFRSQKKAVTCVCGALMLLHIGQLQRADMMSDLPHGLLSCLSFPTAYYFYVRAIGTGAMTGGFITLSRMTSMYAALFLIVDGLFMMLVALYVETVHPGNKQRGAPFFDVFKKSFWFPSNEPPMSDTSVKKDFQVELKSEIEEVVATGAKQKLLDDKKKKKIVREVILEIDGVSLKSTSNNYYFKAVSLKAYKSEILIFYGPRGSGEKELLEVIAGHWHPTTGEIRTILPPGREEPPSIVLASGPNFPANLSVISVCEFVMKMRGHGREDLLPMMEELNLVNLMAQEAAKLKPQEKQLLSLLLAFLGNSDIVLLEEPFKNCNPTMRTAMYTFIMKRKANKSVIISTYDPMHVEDIADSIAFFSNGDLVSYGPVQSVRHKYISYLSLNIWPASGFENSKIESIRKLVEKFLKADIKSPIKTEYLPNECVRYFIPQVSNQTIPKLLAELKTASEQLGIKHTEMVRLSIQDAYHNCCLKREGKAHMKFDAQYKILDDLYQEVKGSYTWPEWSLIVNMKVHFMKAYWLLFLLTTILPIGSVVCLSLLAKFYRLTAEYVDIAPQLMDDGNIGHGRMIANSNFKLNYPSITLDTSKNSSFLYSTSWFYDEPPYVLGLIHEQDVSGSIYHLFSLALVRFSDFLVANLLSNHLMGANNIYCRLESVNTEEWKFLIPLAHGNKKSSMLTALPRKLIANVLIGNEVQIFIFGGCISVLTAQVALFSAKISADNCIRMHYLMGARPVLYWMAIFIVDFIQFLVFTIVILAAPLYYFGNFLGYILGLWVSVLTYISYIPFVYIAAIRSKNMVATYVFFIIFVGSITIMPGCMDLMGKPFGYRLEWWTDFFLFLAWVCPPLAATLFSTITSYLIQHGYSMNAIFDVLGPLMTACFIHAWSWILLFIVTSSYFLEKWAKVEFAYDSLFGDEETVYLQEDVPLIATLPSAEAIEEQPPANASKKKIQKSTMKPVDEKKLARMKAMKSTMLALPGGDISNKGITNDPTNAERKKPVEDNKIRHIKELLASNKGLGKTKKESKNEKEPKSKEVTKESKDKKTTDGEKKDEKKGKEPDTTETKVSIRGGASKTTDGGKNDSKDDKKPEDPKTKAVTKVETNLKMRVSDDTQSKIVPNQNIGVKTEKITVPPPAPVAQDNGTSQIDFSNTNIQAVPLPKIQLIYLKAKPAGAPAANRKPGAGSPRRKLAGKDEKKEDKKKADDKKKDDGKKKDEKKKEEKKDEVKKKEEDKKDDKKKDEKKDDVKKKKDEKKDEKKDDGKKKDEKKEDGKKDGKKEDGKKAEAKKDDVKKKEDTKKEDLKKDINKDDKSDDRKLSVAVKKSSETVTKSLDTKSKTAKRNAVDASAKVTSSAAVRNSEKQSAALPSPSLDSSILPSASELPSIAITNLNVLEERIRGITYANLCNPESAIGLWSHRDQVGVPDPTLEWVSVPLGHFSKQQLCTISVFESQSLNIFGDLPSTKSRLLDMAATQNYPPNGHIYVNMHKANLRSGVGYIPTDDRLCSLLTGRCTLEMAAKFKKYEDCDKVATMLITLCDLEAVADVVVSNYSISDRRMLQFAVAIVDRPTTLLMDELDMYISSSRMKLVWALVAALRTKYKVPLVFTSPRAHECEQGSSHTAMLFKGTIAMGDTTVSIKKKFKLLAILTLTLQDHMMKDSTATVVASMLDCQIQPHPHPRKISVVLSMRPKKAISLLSKVRNVMSTIGIHDYQIESPNLSQIYSAHFSPLDL